MVLKNGEIANIDEIYDNIIGPMWKNQAQSLYNQSLIGFNSKLNGTGVPNLKNIKYDVFNTDTMTETNMQYDATNKLYWGPTDPTESEYSVYDDCNNSSVDLTKWDIASSGDASVVTEDGTSQLLHIVMSGGDGSSTTSTSKLLSLTNNSMVMFNVPLAYTYGNSSGSCTASITFGGATLFTQTKSGTGNITTTNMKFQIIKAGTLYYYRKYSSSAWGAWTIFTPTTNVLVFSVTTNATDSAGGDLTFNSVRYNTLATPLTGTSFIISPATSASVLDCIATSNYSVGPEANSGVEIYVSSDNGAHYELCTDATIHRFTNTGTSLLVKLVLKGAGSISEYAVLYNLGAS